MAFLFNGLSAVIGSLCTRRSAPASKWVGRVDDLEGTDNAGGVTIDGDHDGGNFVKVDRTRADEDSQDFTEYDEHGNPLESGEDGEHQYAENDEAYAEGAGEGFDDEGAQYDDDGEYQQGEGGEGEGEEVYVVYLEDSDSYFIPANGAHMDLTGLIDLMLDAQMITSDMVDSITHDDAIAILDSNSIATYAGRADEEGNVELLSAPADELEGEEGEGEAEHEDGVDDDGSNNGEGTGQTTTTTATAPPTWSPSAPVASVRKPTLAAVTAAATSASVPGPFGAPVSQPFGRLSGVPNNLNSSTTAAATAHVGGAPSLPPIRPPVIPPIGSRTGSVDGPAAGGVPPSSPFPSGGPAAYRSTSGSGGGTPGIASPFAGQPNPAAFLNSPAAAAAAAAAAARGPLRNPSGSDVGLGPAGLMFPPMPTSNTTGTAGMPKSPAAFRPQH